MSFGTKPGRATSLQQNCHNSMLSTRMLVSRLINKNASTKIKCKVLLQFCEKTSLTNTFVANIYAIYKAV